MTTARRPTPFDKLLEAEMLKQRVKEFMADNVQPHEYEISYAHKIKMEHVSWAWGVHYADDWNPGLEMPGDGHSRIPNGELTLTAGPAGTGKSSFNTWLAAQITNGTLPGCFYNREECVIIAATEESVRHTIVPRLKAAGAALDNVLFFTTTNGRLTLPRDIGSLENAVQIHEPAMVYFDSLMSVFDEDTSSNTAQNTRGALQPLANLAAAYNFMAIGNVHLSKARGDVLGSVEFQNVPRAILMFGTSYKKDTREARRRWIWCGKNNLGKDWPSLEYKIESSKFRLKRGAPPFDVGIYVPVGEYVPDEKDIRHGPRPVKREACWTDIQELFKRQDGWPSQKIKDELRARGHSDDVINSTRRHYGITVGKYPDYVWTRSDVEWR